MDRKHKIEPDTISRLKAEDISAFDSVYRFYSPKLYGFAFNLLKSRADAEEIVQEVFLKLWKNRHKIDLEASFDSFLFAIAYHSIISQLRKRTSEQKYIEYAQSMQAPASYDTTLNNLEMAELKEKIQNIIEDLPPRQKEVFKLSREEGLSYQEIAENLQISVNTVENHMSRALKYIKSKMNGQSLLLSLFFHLFY